MKRLLAMMMLVFACSAFALETGDRLKRVTANLSPVSEILQETSTKVVVREHPRTGRPYVSVNAADVPDQDPWKGNRKNFSRPDYRMLDPRMKSGQVPYAGPASDRRKVYAFAASMAALGAAGGVAGILAPAAATASSGAGGAGVYAAGGAAVTAGTAGAAYHVMHTDRDHFEHHSESKVHKG